MILKLKWFGVPVAFAVFEFCLLYVWWTYGPPTPVDDSLAAMGVGSLSWIASATFLISVVVFIVTALVFAFLPPISWKQVCYVALGTVWLNAMSGYIISSLWGGGKPPTEQRLSGPPLAIFPW
jgi:hypothetical protein